MAPSGQGEHSLLPAWLNVLAGHAVFRRTTPRLTSACQPAARRHGVVNRAERGVLSQLPPAWLAVPAMHAARFTGTWRFGNDSCSAYFAGPGPVHQLGPAGKAY